MRIRDWGSDVCASDLIQQPSHGIITESLAKDFPQIEAIARADTTQAVFVENGEPTYVDTWLADADLFKLSSVARRVGQEGFCTCRSGGLPCTEHQTNH